MARNVSILKYGYKFKKFDIGKADLSAVNVDFDDKNWENVRVPHDWAITGVFDKNNDPRERHWKTNNGETVIIYTGTTGGLPSIGEGIYRLWIDIPADAKNKDITLEFDGVMWQSTVYCNGKKAGGCHFGYKSFEVDITDFVKIGEKNLIAVHAVVEEYCGRWYSGAGIYRNVRLVYKNKNHISYDGIWLKQLAVDKENAVFEANIDAVGESLKKSITVYDKNGNTVCATEFTEDCGLFTIAYPELWDITNPVLYNAEIMLYDKDNNVADEAVIRFGVRVSKFTKDGYFLNGRYRKLHGVCMHHDIGSLGAAVNVSALKRQLKILKEMGVNSIRTSHNPPTPELLDLCDEYGIVVMDEFFDEWAAPKVKNGYAKYFNEHAEKDVEDIIKRDRNHPSVIMWSIGNEIEEQALADGWRVAKALAEKTKAMDSTREVTFGLNNSEKALINNLVHYVDVVGLNYKARCYRQWRQQFPDMIMVGAETDSCTSTRDVYHFPADIDIPVKKVKELTVSAYELSASSWAYYAEREIAAQADCPFVAGQYIWTGFDYLGEPTPYLHEWPSRSSHFGVIDLAGLPKNRYYLYKSVWTDEKVLHVFPHWTWHGKEGENIPVHVFTNLPKVELFVNGESQGIRRHESTNEIDRFRMRWDGVIYQPGEIKVIGYDFYERPIMEKTIKTAGAPHHIELECDRNTIVADGDDLCYITATIVDKDGIACMHDQRLTFKVTDNVEFLTTDAGDQRETESFYRPDKMTLGSKLVACVRSIKDVKGEFTVTCSGEGLITASITVKAE